MVPDEHEERVVEKRLAARLAHERAQRPVGVAEVVELGALEAGRNRRVPRQRLDAARRELPGRVERHGQDHGEHRPSGRGASLELREGPAEHILVRDAPGAAESDDRRNPAPRGRRRSRCRRRIPACRRRCPGPRTGRACRSRARAAWSRGSRSRAALADGGWRRHPEATEKKTGSPPDPAPCVRPLQSSSRTAPPRRARRSSSGVSAGEPPSVPTRRAVKLSITTSTTWSGWPARGRFDPAREGARRAIQPAPARAGRGRGRAPPARGAAAPPTRAGGRRRCASATPRSRDSGPPSRRSRWPPDSRCALRIRD